LQKLRNANSKDIWERLFVMMTLGDDRNIAQTWVSGKPVWQRESEEQIA
jgi:guanine deaminase